MIQVADTVHRIVVESTVAVLVRRLVVRNVVPADLALRTWHHAMTRVADSAHRIVVVSMVAVLVHRLVVQNIVPVDLALSTWHHDVIQVADSVHHTTMVIVARSRVIQNSIQGEPGLHARSTVQIEVPRHPIVTVTTGRVVVQKLATEIMVAVITKPRTTARGHASIARMIELKMRNHPVKSLSKNRRNR